MPKIPVRQLEAVCSLISHSFPTAEGGRATVPHTDWDAKRNVGWILRTDYRLAITKECLKSHDPGDVASALHELDYAGALAEQGRLLLTCTRSAPKRGTRVVRSSDDWRLVTLAQRLD
jgi:hypothetical protein